MSSITGPPTRREKNRIATQADIKATARDLLIETGPTGVSLREIARRLNMSAPAIYRYYDGLEALLSALCVDLYTELRETLLSDMDAHPPEDLLDRVLTAARSFRRWAVTHQAEFIFMFASRAPGAVITHQGDTAAVLDPDTEPYRSMLAFSNVFGNVFNRIYHQSDQERGYPLHTPRIPRLSPGLRDEIHRCSEAIGIRDMPIEFAYTFHSFWIRLYGLVSMEVFGQLPVIRHAGDLLEAELQDMADHFGVDLSARS